MKKLTYIGFALLLLASTACMSQDFDRYVSVSWDFNQPLTNTNWIKEGSGLGAKIGYHKMLNDRFAVGVDAAWAVYRHYEPTTTFINNDGAITTDYFNYIYSYSFMASGNYFLPSSSKKLMPFVGLGLGASQSKFVQYYNVYTDKDQSWGFIARPEVGLLVPFGGKLGLQVAAHYDYTTAGSDRFNYSGFSHFGVSVGLVSMSY